MGRVREKKGGRREEERRRETGVGRKGKGEGKVGERVIERENIR